MKIKFKDILVFVTTITFLIAPLLKGTASYIFLVATLALCVLCMILIKKAYVGVIFFLMAMQNALQMLVPRAMLQAVTYYDELFQVVIIFYLLYVMVKKRINLTYLERILIVCYGLYLLLCFLSSVFNDYATVTVIVLDAFVCVKFFLFYRGGLELSRQGLRIQKRFTSIQILRARL